MKYILLIYENEDERSNRNEEQMKEIMGRYFSFTESIKKDGKYVAGDALHSISTATTVRVRGGKTAVTDGPFAETKEQLGGFYIVDAADLDEATALAARIPSSETGTIEVRPIMVFE